MPGLRASRLAAVLLVAALIASSWGDARAARRPRPGLCSPANAGRSYLGIVSAYPAELAPIVAAATIEGTVDVGGHSYYVGQLAGVRVMLGLTGIGMLNATDASRALLAGADLAGLIMSGTAGTRHHIGDVVVASELEDTKSPGGGLFHPNPALVSLARRAAVALPEPLEQCTPVPPQGVGSPLVCLLFPPEVRLGGHAVSTDDFGDAPFPCSPGAGEIFGCGLPSPSTVAAARIVAPTISTQDVEDNESAAVAREATRRHVPFVAIRAASDGDGDPLGDRGFPAQFFDYYRLAAHNAADLTRALVATLGSLAHDPSARRTCRLLAAGRWRPAARHIGAMP